MVKNKSKSNKRVLFIINILQLLYYPLTTLLFISRHGEPQIRLVRVSGPDASIIFKYGYNIILKSGYNIILKSGYNIILKSGYKY